jgi:hypothetical protein
MSTLAFVLALGGGAAIAKQALLNGKDIKPRSIPANRIVRHSLTGTEINLGKLGVPHVRWALVDQNGNIISQSGGITVDHAGTGTYVFGLGQSVAGVSESVTPANQFDDSSRIDISTAPCGLNGAIGQENCGSTSANDGRHIVAFTANSFFDSSGLQDEGFYIDFIS